jgi:outer membrane beta-barrel protein
MLPGAVSTHEDCMSEIRQSVPSARLFHRILGGLVVLGVLLAARPAAAEDEETIATYAVQNRQFGLGHELFGSIGILPLDAFVKGLTVGGGYTYHFSQSWAWEVFNIHYSKGIDTGLKKELLENFQVQPTQIDQLNYLASTNVVMKPLYGKFAWFNDKVVHAELDLVVGAGVGKYQYAAFNPALDAGGAIRLYLSRRSSLRLDLRYYAFFGKFLPPEVKNELHITLSYALSVGGK